MIQILLKGGLGNQMFQVATGVAVSIHQETSWSVVFPDQSGSEKAIETPRDFALGIYGIRNSKLLSNGSQIAVKETVHGFDSSIINAHPDSIIDGYFQSYKYFTGVEDAIRELFVPVDDLDTKFSELIKQIDLPGSVSVHVRRGDYIADSATYEYHGITGLPYYERAISYIRSKISDPRFFVFSDDPEWARKIFSQPEFTHVTGNIGDNSWMDMHLMKRCRHNIIANSSFSWWSAWLNSNPDKIVIGPRRWFVAAAYNTADLFPPDWIQVDNYSCKFSIVIPTYNRSALLVRAIQSVLAQTAKDFEILVCDDGSTDDTADRVRALKDARIRYFYTTNSGRPATPRNMGLAKAQGEWICFLDSDDEWTTNKLEVQSRFATLHGYKITSTNATKVDGDGSERGLYFETPLSQFFELSDLIEVNYLICSSVICHAEAIAGLRFDESDIAKAYEDYEIWLKIVSRNTVGYIDEPLVHYLMDSSSSVRRNVEFTDSQKRQHVLKSLLSFLVQNRMLRQCLLLRGHLKNFWKELVRQIITEGIKR